MGVSGFDSVCAMLDKSRFSAGSLLTGAVLALAAALLSACAPAAPAKPDDELPAVTQLFASDQEALDAAVEVYREYLFVSDLIMQDGGANPERIETYASGQALEYSLESFDVFKGKGLRSVGFYNIQNTLLQQRRTTAEGTDVHFYACNDISAIDIIDENGKSTLTDTRAYQFVELVQVSFTSEPSGMVSHLEFWQGLEVCNAT